MKPLEHIHENRVRGRRARVLTGHLCELIPKDASVLEVGAGDGLLLSSILAKRPDLSAEGIDVLARDDAHVPVATFDGRTIPHGDATFDGVMFVDVLHHTEDPMVLLREAKRVAKSWILLKDHALDGVLAGPTLRFMDKVGNERHGVALPYNYWATEKWQAAFAELDLKIESHRGRLGLYPWPFSTVFDRALHFACLLRRKDA